MAVASVSGFLRKLLAEGMLTDAQLAEARALRLGSRQSMVQCVAKLGYIEEGRLVALLAEHTRLPVIDLNKVKPDPDLVLLLPYRIARERGVLPISAENSVVTVALSDPTDVVVRDELGAFLGGRQIA